MPPKSKLWPLDDHTKGKHLVLQQYLNAWLPIMSKYNDRLLIIDGFSGPGIYKNGEPGSPIIMIDTFLNHAHKQLFCNEVIFFFIESNSERAEHLNCLLTEKYKNLPHNMTIKVINHRFDAMLTQVLDVIEDQNSQLAPCFTMIDPFGVSDTPMSVLEKLFRNPKSEVYISFMYSHINRFKKSKEFTPHLNSLFGCNHWQSGVDIEDKSIRKDFFYQLYKDQLKQAGANQVVHFDLYRKNSLVYAIFFATQHHRGSDKMKQAIWKTVPDGSLMFKGSHTNHITIGTENTDFEPLIQSLKHEFGDGRWVSIAEIQNYVASDLTDFHTGQTKKKALAILEKHSLIEVNPKTRKRRNTYPEGTLLRFKA